MYFVWPPIEYVVYNTEEGENTTFHVSNVMCAKTYCFHIDFVHFALDTGNIVSFC